MGDLIPTKELIELGKLFIFDTNVLIDAYNELKMGEGPTKRYLDNIPRGRRTTTVVNLFEFAFVQDVRHEEMEKRRRWLRNYGIRVLPLSKNASETFYNLSRAHKPPSTLLADMLIASIAIVERCVLVTRNVSDFRRIRGLDLVSEFAIEKI